MVNILIVEDQYTISKLIETVLTSAGYNCKIASDGKIAADILQDNDFDLVLLDIMLPQIDGYELMEYIEPMGMPVIFLTAKGKTHEKVKGLRMGADDYIVKPFDTDELLARVEVVLKRYNKGLKKISAGDVVVDIQARTVEKDGQNISLTPKEFDLLTDLIRNKGITLYRETLYERVWEEAYKENTRTLDLHIQRLRKKLDWQDKIKTVHRIGYLLDL